MTTIADGTNDITLLSSEKSRLQFAKLLILQDDGDYFNGPSSRNPGAISESMGLDYLKASSWSLKPRRKGTPPEGYQLPEGIRTYANEIYSIDGEKYPAQDIQGKVLKQALPIFI